MALSEQQLEALKEQFTKDILSVINNKTWDEAAKRNAIAFITRSMVALNPQITANEFKTVANGAKKAVHPDVSKFPEDVSKLVNATIGNHSLLDALKQHAEIVKQAEANNSNILSVDVFADGVQHVVYYDKSANKVIYPPHFSEDDQEQLAKKAVPEIKRELVRQNQQGQEQRQEPAASRRTQQEPHIGQSGEDVRVGFNTIADNKYGGENHDRAIVGHVKTTNPYQTAIDIAKAAEINASSQQHHKGSSATYNQVIPIPGGMALQYQVGDGALVHQYTDKNGKVQVKIHADKPDHINMWHGVSSGDGIGAPLGGEPPKGKWVLYDTNGGRIEVRPSNGHTVTAEDIHRHVEQHRKTFTPSEGKHQWMTTSDGVLKSQDHAQSRHPNLQGEDLWNQAVEDRRIEIERRQQQNPNDPLEAAIGHGNNKDNKVGAVVEERIARGPDGKLKSNINDGKVVVGVISDGMGGMGDEHSRARASHAATRGVQKYIIDQGGGAVLSHNNDEVRSPATSRNGTYTADIQGDVPDKGMAAEREPVKAPNVERKPGYRPDFGDPVGVDAQGRYMYRSGDGDTVIVPTADYKPEARAQQPALPQGWESHPTRQNSARIDVTDRIGGATNSADLANRIAEWKALELKGIAKVTENNGRIYVVVDTSHPDAISAMKHVINPGGVLDTHYQQTPQQQQQSRDRRTGNEERAPAQQHSHWKLDPTSPDYAQKLAELRSLKITKTRITTDGRIHIAGTHPVTGEKITAGLSKEQYKIVDPLNHALQFGTPAERQAVQQELQSQQQARQQQGTEPQQEQRQQQQQSRDQRGADAKPADAKPVDTKPADAKTPANTAPHKSDAKIAGRINGAGLGVGVLGVAMADDPTAKTVAAAQATAGFAGLAANLKLIQNSPGAAKLLAAGLLFANGGLTIAQAKLEWEKLSTKEKAQLAGAGIIGFIPVVAGAAITSFLTATFPPLAPFAGALTAAVGVLAGAVGAGIGGAIYEIGAGINEGIAHFGKGIENFKQGNIGAGIWNIVDGLVTINPTIYNKTFLKAGLSLVEGTVGSIAGMGAMVVAGVPKLGGIAANWLGSGLNAMGFTNAGEGLKNWGKKLDGAATSVMQGFQHAQESYTAAKEKVVGVVTNVYEGAKNIVGNVASGIVSGAKSIWGFFTGTPAQAAPAVPAAPAEAVKPEAPKAAAPTQVLPPRPVPMPTPEATFPKFHSANINHLPDFKIIGKQDGIAGGYGFAMKEQAPRYMVEFPDGRRAWMQDTGKMLLSNPPQSSVTLDFIDKNGKPVTDKDGKPVVEHSNIPTASLNAAIEKYNHPGKQPLDMSDKPILNDLVYRHPINIKIGGGVLTEADKRRGEFLDMLGLQRDQIQLLPHRITGLAERNPGYTALLMAMEAIQPGSMKNLRIEDMKQGKIPDSMKGLLVDASALLKFGDATTTVKGQTNIFDYMQTRTQTLFPEPQPNLTIAKYVDAGQPKAAQPILTDEQRKQITALREVQKTAQVVK